MYLDILQPTLACWSRCSGVTRVPHHWVKHLESCARTAELHAGDHKHRLTARKILWLTGCPAYNESSSTRPEHVTPNIGLQRLCVVACCRIFFGSRTSVTLIYCMKVGRCTSTCICRVEAHLSNHFFWPGLCSTTQRSCFDQSRST